MQQELKSEGKCLYCQNLFPQVEMGKHLATHLNDIQKESKDLKTDTFCHIEVEAYEMFLHLLVRGSAKMKVIDTYLRNIWLECCGHMSEFYHKDFKVSMNHSVQDVFSPRIKIQHNYDFGTTTTVILKAKKKYQLAGKSDIVLLSRNEPLKHMCALCKKNAATVLCAVCNWNEYAFYCDNCAIKHAEKCEDFEDYAKMPVVNSPRMGECGYCGGSIDLERDVYSKK